MKDRDYNIGFLRFFNRLIKYFLLYFCAILVFYFQYRIVTSLNSKFLNKYFQG